MYYFFELSVEMRLVLQIMLLFGTAAQIILLIVRSFVRSTKISGYQIAIEVGVFYHFLILNLSIGLIQISEPLNLYFPPYPILRLLSIIAPVIGSIGVIKHNRVSDILAVVCLVVSLPFMEELTGRWYVNLVFVSTILLFFRAIYELKLNYEHLQMNLSRISMKQAFDSFPEGLAIGRHHGNVSILNMRMKNIMKEKGLSPDKRSSGLRASFRRMIKTEAIKAKRDSELNITLAEMFWESEQKRKEKSNDQTMLLQKNDKKNRQKVLKKRSVFRAFTCDDSVYRYTEEAFSIGRKKYWQILLSDISEESDLIRQIRDKNEVLEENNRQLMEMLRNIEEIELEKETRRMRNRIHDVMGQRLSIIHSSLQQMDRKEEVPLEDLLELLEDMMLDLNEPESLSPERRFQNIKNTADIVGTELLKEGEIPDNKEVAAVFMQVLREAVTNAIRHGQASRVVAKFKQDEDFYLLSVVNDGSVPFKRFKEGEGITGMRHKIESMRGELTINTDKLFSVSAKVPIDFLETPETISTN